MRSEFTVSLGQIELALDLLQPKYRTKIGKSIKAGSNPAFSFIRIYTVYRNPSMLLLYKKDLNPHGHWTGEGVCRCVCMANTIIT